jgi:hypothetical protein
MRTRFRWTVTLHARTGETVEETVETFWDPKHEGTREAIGVTGMVQAWLRVGKPTEKASDAFFPAAVSLV